MYIISDETHAVLIQLLESHSECKHWENCAIEASPEGSLSRKKILAEMQQTNEMVNRLNAATPIPFIIA